VPEGYIVVLDEGPEHAVGNFEIAPNGSFTYTHDGSHPYSEGSSDYFSYNLVPGEGTGPTSSAEVFIYVDPVNDTPTISSVGNQNTPINTTIGPIPFEVCDEETEPYRLVVTGTSNNQTLVPNGNIVITKNPSEAEALCDINGDRWVTITPAAGQTGSALITLTVNDNPDNVEAGQTASTSFTLQVTGAANTPPTANPDAATVVRNGTVTTLVGGATVPAR
jgi:hypothetical protein